MSTYAIDVAGVRRELELVEIAGGRKIALLNAAGDTELIVRSIERLLELAPPFEVILGPALVGAVLAHQASVISERPYAVARKSPPLDAPEPISSIVRSIKATHEQRLYLGARDAATILSKRVLIVDDVVATGDTLRAVEELVRVAGGQVAARLAIATEGAPRSDVSSLVHLPIFEP
jgi:adenine phosphoribosyltransferase